MADYLVLYDTKKTGCSVSLDFKEYKLFEKEYEQNAMKCRFKNNKVLTAVKETVLTSTTAKGRTMQKKLAAKHIKVQHSKNPDEPRKPTSRYRRCGRFSNGNNCETHKMLMTEKNRSSHTQVEAKCSRTLPTMPSNESVDDLRHTPSTRIVIIMTRRKPLMQKK